MALKYWHDDPLRSAAWQLVWTMLKFAVDAQAPLAPSSSLLAPCDATYTPPATPQGCVAGTQISIGLDSAPQHVISTGCVSETWANYGSNDVTAVRLSSVEWNNQSASSAQECCHACKRANEAAQSDSSKACNIWNWCGNPGGCCSLRTGCRDPTATQDNMFAANSCYLKYQVSLDVNNWGGYALDESAPLTYYTAADVAKWDARDDGIVTNCQAFTSGVYLEWLVGGNGQTVPGYDTHPALDYPNRDLQCTSLAPGCQADGTIQEYPFAPAAACTPLPQCAGFVYDIVNTQGFLKAIPPNVSEECVKINPRAAFSTKKGPLSIAASPASSPVQTGTSPPALQAQLETTP